MLSLRTVTFYRLSRVDLNADSSSSSNQPNPNRRLWRPRYHSAIDLEVNLGIRKSNGLDSVEEPRKSPNPHSGVDEDDDHHRGHYPAIKQWFSIETYLGAVLFNVATFITLTQRPLQTPDRPTGLYSRSTTDTDTYSSIFVEILDGGPPPAAYLVIGGKTRLPADRTNVCFTIIAI
ncbi:hypothetical protein FS837_004171 [Tulasnella sp. UAMH 9824]|nr:hypothetical protein FS837_004171 [Tulasnella sp. UAMH 9824]